MTDDEPLLAVAHADARLMRILLIESEVIQNKRQLTGFVQANGVRPALEIVTAAYKSGGITSHQLRALENIEDKVRAHVS